MVIWWWRRVVFFPFLRAFFSHSVHLDVESRLSVEFLGSPPWPTVVGRRGPVQSRLISRGSAHTPRVRVRVKNNNDDMTTTHDKHTQHTQQTHTHNKHTQIQPQPQPQPQPPQAVHSSRLATTAVGGPPLGHASGRGHGRC